MVASLGILNAILVLALSAVSVIEANVECGAHELREHAGENSAVEIASGPVEGLACAGFAEDRRCCQALPAQRIQAWLQFAVKHHRDQILGFDALLASVDITAASLPQGPVSEGCAPLAKAALEQRAHMARTMAGHALNSLGVIEHLVLSGVCSYCFPEEEAADFRVSSQDGPAARQLSSIAVMMQAGQKELRAADAEVLARDPERKCVPRYLSVLLEGCAAGEVNMDGVSSEDSAFANSVEAVARQRRWALDRRKLSAELAREAHDHFDDDFFEAGERLMGFLIAAPARLVHQAQILALAMGSRFHWSSNHPVAHILWGTQESEHSIDPATDSSRGSSEDLRSKSDPGKGDGINSNFGFVALISNRTSAGTVDELLSRFEGQRVLFLEDTCGNALEALGYNCHNGGQEQGRCLHPVHATRLSLLLQDPDAPMAWDEGKRPRIAWRRHASTRSVAHSVWALATSYWGDDCDVWVADFRPESECNEGASLASAVTEVPGARLHIVHEPGRMLGMGSTSNPADEDIVSPADADSGIAKPSEVALHWEHKPLAERLAEYIELHRHTIAALDSPEKVGSVPSGGFLIYSCQPYAQCGGHGDRLNGIITAFFLAVLTRRIFLIDSESPLPLQMLLAPGKVDWRLRGGLLATAILRHHSYHDKRRNFEADIDRLAEYPDNVLVLTKNYRMLRSLFEAPVFRERVEALGLPVHAPPFLVAEAFELLFTPTMVLRGEMEQLRAKLHGLEDRKFIGVHLRTGDVAWDPARHGKGELSTFLDCARKAEMELNLTAGEEIPWLLATDSADVAEAAAATPEAQSGKLRVPEAGGRIHIDRSDLGEVLEGVTSNFAEWLLFGRAAAVVLSRSFFGETAAEIGRVRNAYFAPGGGCVRMELSSS